MRAEIATFCLLVLGSVACDEAQPASTHENMADAQIANEQAGDAGANDASAEIECGDPRELGSPCRDYVVRLMEVDGEPCAFSIEERIDAIGYENVFVTLDEQWVKRADGYRIVDDGWKLELTGRACELYSDGREHSLVLVRTCLCVERVTDAPPAPASPDGGATSAPVGADSGDVLAGDGGSDLASPYPDLITVQEGTLPIVLSAPHGGESPIPNVPVRTSLGAVTTRDANTYELALAIQSELLAQAGARARLVAARAARKYVDFNRAAADAYEHQAAAPVYDAYHATLAQAVRSARAQSPSAALLVDVHGQGVSATTIYRGTRNGKTASLTTLHAAPLGFLTSLIAAGATLSPDAANSPIPENASFTGGYIVGTYGLTGAERINAVQLELGTSYRSPESTRDQTARWLAEALIAHLKATGAL